MRLWSIHPKYLDTKGLLAVWREGLLAQKVLSGKTRGYRRHPQLERFRGSGRPMSAIRDYLLVVCRQAKMRGYAFNECKVSPCGNDPCEKICVSRGQLAFEFGHLLSKLKTRDAKKYKELRKVKRISAHPLFRIVAGSKESWERGGRRGSCA